MKSPTRAKLFFKVGYLHLIRLLVFFLFGEAHKLGIITANTIKIPDAVNSPEGDKLIFVIINFII
jgi:hypothetical protein